MHWLGQAVVVSSHCSNCNVVNDARYGGCARERRIFMPHHIVVGSALVSGNSQNLETGNLASVAPAVELLAAAHVVVHSLWPVGICCGDDCI